MTVSLSDFLKVPCKAPNSIHTPANVAPELAQTLILLHTLCMR